VIVYAESSAVLAWLLGEPEGDAVRVHLGSADTVVSSRLTLAECDAHSSEGWRLRQSALVTPTSPAISLHPAVRWSLAEVGGEVLDILRNAFPKEPVRTLDAIHLATIIVVRPTAPDMAVLSLDARIRDNASLLGLEVVPRGA
jgi:hypothetical protein